MQKATAYTDGSYNKELGIYGCGAVLLIDGRPPVILFDSGKAESGSNGWNINGEINAAVMAAEKAIELGAQSLVIKHDYEGVGKWPDFIWKANKSYTIDYANKINQLRKQIDIQFSWVKGHSNNHWNDVADAAAKFGAKLLDAIPDTHEHKNADPWQITEQELPNGLTQTGRQTIMAFMKKKNPTFRDFAALKTGGTDTFSKMRITEMEASLGNEITFIIKQGLNDDSGYASALRWAMRGLCPDDAAHKVNVDQEIGRNCRKPDNVIW